MGFFAKSVSRRETPGTGRSEEWRARVKKEKDRLMNLTGRRGWIFGRGDRENGKKGCCVSGLAYYRGVERRIAPAPQTIPHGGGEFGHAASRTDGILMPRRKDSRADEKKFPWAREWIACRREIAH